MADRAFLSEGVAGLKERYQNNWRRSRLSDSFVPFLNFKLKKPQREEWLATQSTPPGSATLLGLSSNLAAGVKHHFP